MVAASAENVTQELQRHCFAASILERPKNRYRLTRMLFRGGHLVCVHICLAEWHKTPAKAPLIIDLPENINSAPTISNGTHRLSASPIAFTKAELRHSHTARYITGSQHL